MGAGSSTYIKKKKRNCKQASTERNVWGMGVRGETHGRGDRREREGGVEGMRTGGRERAR